MNPLQGLYLLGLKLDRVMKESVKVKLSYPVVSIGNISVGGRAKTPLVIEVCNYLRKKKYEPVVLTRGYARKSFKDIWLLPETLPHLQNLTVENCGDEAIEIFLKAKVAVLIGSNRAKQAQKFTEQYGSAGRDLPKGKKYIFVLDDGFQHWRLDRDIDVVVMSEADKQDSLLPTGRLREGVWALERADIVYELGRDVRKKMHIYSGGLLPDACVAITTRAGSQVEYNQELNRALNFSVPLLELKDHLDVAKLKERILLFRPKTKQLILGMKEAVKLLAPSELMSPTDRSYTLMLGDRSFEVFIAQLELDWNKEEFEQMLLIKGLS